MDYYASWAAAEDFEDGADPRAHYTEELALLPAHRGSEELINIGAYAQGSNPVTDVAIGLKPAIDAFLRQDRDERTDFPLTCRALCELAAESERQRQASSS